MEKGSSSSSSSGGGSASDSLNGLKFGKKIYFEGVGSGPPSPAKKGRTGVVHGGQPPRCQVEGCKVDLSDAKAYYGRHKVCGMHSKSPKVTVAGIEQRFCQQCSRFHELCEFDQGKRSCRRRLAGHNERRRKPPPGPLLSSRYGYGTLSPSTLDNQSLTGGFVMDFSSYSAVAGRDDSYPNERAFGNQANNNITGKYQQLPWQQSSSHNQHPHLPLHGYVAAQECFNGASDSNSALSLLSSHPTTLGVNTFLATATNGGTPSVQPPQFSSWGFKGNQGNSNHEMHADMGLGGQISQDGQYGGALGLSQPSHGQYHELEPSRAYDSSIQHMHGSL